VGEILGISLEPEAPQDMQVDDYPFKDFKFPDSKYANNAAGVARAVA
jgi:hypothetical protein